MKTMSVDQLPGVALDWAVAVAEGYTPIIEYPEANNTPHIVANREEFSPFARWDQAVPLRDKYDMSITPIGNRVEAGINIPTGGDDYDSLEIVGSTACEAICRLVVLRCLGPTVTVPAVLVKDGESQGRFAMTAHAQDCRTCRFMRIPKQRKDGAGKRIACDFPPPPLPVIFDRALEVWLRHDSEVEMYDRASDTEIAFPKSGCETWQAKTEGE